MLSLRHLLIRSFSSKFKPPNKVRYRTEALTSVLENNHTNVDWENVRHELISQGKFINKLNLDGIVIDGCLIENRLDIAKSYIEFLKSQSLQINDATVGKLVRLYHRRHRKNQETNSSTTLPAQDEDEIIQLCESLMKKYEILDASLAENLIYGLSLTRDWMKCLELLKHIEFTSSPSSAIYSCIISKALKEDNLDIVWNLLNIALEKQLAPSTFVIKEYFSKFKDNDEAMEKMLNFMGENSLMLPEDQIKEFKNIFKDRECNIAKLARKGFCQSCSEHLKKVEFNEEEFKKLSKSFLEDVMMRNDVFLKTNPEELKKFMKFVDISLPFDCVIDGLNVAFSHGAQPPVMMAKNVELVVKYFAERGLTCLVIGRRHMNKWPNPQMDFIRKNSSLFLAENISQDDPFMLYAALKNGPNTKIFSRDLMRSHSHLLDKESRKLFRRWQLQNQYSLITTLKEKSIVVQQPVSFEVKAQKIESRWHIPFTSENFSFSHETFELPSSWLCVEIGDNE